MSDLLSLPHRSHLSTESTVSANAAVVDGEEYDVIETTNEFSPYSLEECGETVIGPWDSRINWLRSISDSSMESTICPNSSIVMLSGRQRNDSSFSSSDDCEFFPIDELDEQPSSSSITSPQQRQISFFHHRRRSRGSNDRQRNTTPTVADVAAALTVGNAQNMTLHNVSHWISEDAVTSRPKHPFYRRWLPINSFRLVAILFLVAVYVTLLLPVPEFPDQPRVLTTSSSLTPEQQQEDANIRPLVDLLSISARTSYLRRRLAFANELPHQKDLVFRNDVQDYFHQQALLNHDGMWTIPWYANATVLFSVMVWAFQEHRRQRKNVYAL